MLRTPKLQSTALPGASMHPPHQPCHEPGGAFGAVELLRGGQRDDGVGAHEVHQVAFAQLSREYHGLSRANGTTAEPFLSTHVAASTFTV